MFLHPIKPTVCSSRIGTASAQKEPILKKYRFFAPLYFAKFAFSEILCEPKIWAPALHLSLALALRWLWLPLLSALQISESNFYFSGAGNTYLHSGTAESLFVT